MPSHYLNMLTVSLRGYSGHPGPENLAEVITLEVDIGRELDLDQLTDELRKDVANFPRAITQTYREVSWGASGSDALLLIDMPNVLTGIASLTIIWNAISGHVLRRGRARNRAASAPGETARATLASSLNVAVQDIRIVGLEPAGDRVQLDTPYGRFTADVDSAGVTRILSTMDRPSGRPEPQALPGEPAAP